MFIVKREIDYLPILKIILYADIFGNRDHTKNSKNFKNSREVSGNLCGYLLHYPWLKRFKKVCNYTNKFIKKIFKSFNIIFLSLFMKSYYEKKTYLNNGGTGQLGSAQ